MDGFAEALGPQFEERYRTLIVQVEESMRRIGLYLDGANVASSEDHPERVYVMARFDIGDLAFTPRVIDPDTAKVDDAVREMEDDMTQARIEAMRQEYLRRKGQTDED